MGAYIYNVYKSVTECTECTSEREHILATGQKWKAVEYLREILNEGLSLHDYDVTRSKDGQADSTLILDAYEFMQIDLGEVM